MSNPETCRSRGVSPSIAPKPEASRATLSLREGTRGPCVPIGSRAVHSEVVAHVEYETGPQEDVKELVGEHEAIRGNRCDSIQMWT